MMFSVSQAVVHKIPGQSDLDTHFEQIVEQVGVFSFLAANSGAVDALTVRSLSSERGRESGRLLAFSVVFSLETAASSLGAC